MPIRVIFLGTPQFAVPTLEALLADGRFEVLGVLTQPDRPAGRGQKLTPPPVKIRAGQAGLPVFQPKSLRKDAELIQWLRDQQPDFLVTVAFGQILSQEVLDIPKSGTVNVHASLLPFLRGPNPIQQTVLQGHHQTGITTMLTDIGVDTGAMLERRVTPILPDETAGDLAERLSMLGAELLVNTLPAFQQGALQPTPQDHDLATHAPKCDKGLALLSWEESAETLHNKIRAFNPAPGAVAFFRGERVKILRSRRTPTPLNSEILLKTGEPGTILAIIEDGMTLQTGDGLLDVLQVQPAGKKPMSARDWANGLFGKNLPKDARFDGTAVSGVMP